MPEKPFTLELSSDTDTLLLREDKVSELRCVIHNNSEFQLEIRNNLFIYILERESTCWELFRKVVSTDQRPGKGVRVLSNEKILLNPGAEKILFKEVLSNLFYQGQYYWNWMCRQHPLSLSPLYKQLGNGHELKDNIVFSGRITGVKVGVKEDWAFSNPLLIALKVKNLDSESINKEI